MSDRARRLVDLIVVAALEGLVPEKVDLIEVTLGQITQAISLVPTRREQVEGDLPADGEGQVQVRELLSHLCHHVFPNIVRQIELLELVALLSAAVPADRRQVQHALTELDEGPSLDGDVEVGNVPQGPVDDPLQVLFTEMSDDTRLADLLAVFVREQSVLGEAVVKHVRAVPQLLLLLVQVRPSDHADANPFAQRLQVLDCLRRDDLARFRQCAIDVKQRYYAPILGRHGRR
mmetsp:Transcript_87863/g.253415  ORF Transcript_87863/g.253415 Transcript_87863/m.253415 type:complete len:233 (+) Transcript_87863:191-889(+)